MDWIGRFPELTQLEAPLGEMLAAQSRIVTVPPDTVVFGPGKAPENLLLVIDGTLRVRQFAENGREIMLYRVHAGESCVLTTACLLAHEDYSAEGLTETEVTAVAIPRAVFDELLGNSKAFREFVFAAYSRRITDLFLVIEEIAFRRLDIRLAQKLLDLDDGSHRVETTHQRLASELGTAREVVSRQLADFQRRGWVALSRGSVELQGVDGLKSLAETA